MYWIEAMVNELVQDDEFIEGLGRLAVVMAHVQKGQEG